MSTLVGIALRGPVTIATANAYLAEANLRKTFSWGDEAENFQKLADTIYSSIEKYNVALGIAGAGASDFTDYLNNLQAQFMG